MFPYALVAIFVTSLVLAPSTGLAAGGLFYGAALAGQVLLYLLAGAGAILEFTARRREAALPAVAVAPRPRRAAQEIA